MNLVLTHLSCWAEVPVNDFVAVTALYAYDVKLWK